MHFTTSLPEVLVHLKEKEESLCIVRQDLPNPRYAYGRCRRFDHLGLKSPSQQVALLAVFLG